MDYRDLDFDGRVKLDEGYQSVYVFRPEVLGSGTFADVYRARMGSLDLALKMFSFRPSHGFTREDLVTVVSDVLRNVRSNALGINCPGLVRVHEIGKRSYVMELFEGVSVSSLLKTRKLTPEDLLLAARCYAEVMSFLHQGGFLIGDNNWGSVLIGNGNAKVCDLDLIATESEYSDPNFFALQFGFESYCSLEQHFIKPLGRQSDVEGLALMLDHAFVGDALYPIGSKEQSMYREKLRMGLRHYPDERMDMLPSPLRDLMRRVLDGKRDDTVTAQDFVRALEKI